MTTKVQNKILYRAYLPESTISIIEKLAKELGESKSVALAFIIREWSYQNERHD